MPHAFALARGPGRLSEALGLDRRCDRHGPSNMAVLRLVGDTEVGLAGVVATINDRWRPGHVPRLAPGDRHRSQAEVLQAMAGLDRTYVPAAGRIESSGTPEGLLAHPDLADLTLDWDR